jgi:hypothetical protein
MSDDSLPARIRLNAEAIIVGITRPQRIGRPFDDELLTALRQAFPTATDYHKRMPKLP